MLIKTSDELISLLLTNGWTPASIRGWTLDCPYSKDIHYASYNREFVREVPFKTPTVYGATMDAILLRIHNLKHANLSYDSNTNLLSNEIMAIRIK